VLDVGDLGLGDGHAQTVAGALVDAVVSAFPIAAAERRTGDATTVYSHLRLLALRIAVESQIRGQPRSHAGHTY
jgi:hypothetical protein